MRPPSFRHRLRLTWTLALLAWFAQLCLPVAHAALMAQAPGTMAAWCGDPANAREASAALPAEIREALALDATGADALAHCADLCAVGATPAPLPVPGALSFAAPDGAPLAPARPATVVARRHALPPPSHGPPQRA
ncbi:MAG: hypothetical protein GTN84_13210 [Hydrogenophaga sp.]|uniref:hypothetical protein n=1 Tax=Hydrogenophaga sp. TaxID=1904254 RepID=UPI0016A5DCCD|nr:hypothetical protein [Hydrogenophaga sp.]NIM41935.1 hypothetical protein [Hydrogenophaga sp.]NIN27238.1 hypothetical protein [Hydrogenophaga sp.]NIN31939.1 hypothetical protein [Hydrogenophaga sp.]NIN56332.1 hypothetical protein [Hydrogenophaga sp.]NIO52312.1 hypothetical protein [Hydrogenophaga sp.]